MKASELRLGNWINSYGTDHQIVDSDSIGDCEQYPEKFKPIPITEEWLLKCGFEKDGLVLSKGRISIVDGRVEIESLYISDFNLRLDHIKYRHQLQNLYFDLENEELSC